MILFDIKADLYGPPSNEREDSNAFQARLTVSAVFDQLEPLQAQLTRIASFRELMEQVGDLARVLESMHNFQDRLRPVPNRFAPLEALDQTLKRLCASFAEHLSELADALGPAVELQDQLSHLAGAFKPAKVLREQFLGLAESFASRSSATPDGWNGRNILRGARDE
jgi:DNA repair ATPase RecN